MGMWMGFAKLGHAVPLIELKISKSQFGTNNGTQQPSNRLNIINKHQ